MTNRFSEDLLLTSETGRRLYNAYARDMPIIDYHCHLLPQEISENRQFEDLGEMWLAHDHYKWRAMRTFGIDEKYITGSAGFYEKYLQFAKILPLLIGNPIYIWCALELKRYFDIDEPLGEWNAEEIYIRTKKLIAEKNMTPRGCMEASRVEVACTTEDPVDSLEYHLKMKADPSIKTKILSAFRPDKAFYCEKPAFQGYIPLLAAAAGMEIRSFSQLLEALEKRLLFFKSTGTIISDHGIEELYWTDYTMEEIEGIFAKALTGGLLSQSETAKYRCAFLTEMGSVYYKNGFIMQLHIGTYKGANRGGERDYGEATGFDCTDDSTSAKSVGALLNTLRERGSMPRALLYPLDYTQIETFAILAAGFCEGGTKARVQLGAPWWFNDHGYGIERQLEAIANLYPISLSIGMLTDSRSFLSYPRHELYRRCLCNYFGRLIERGDYFSGEDNLKRVIQDICYYNALEYLRLEG